MSQLDKVDLSHSLTRDEEAKELAKAQRRLLRLRLQIGGQIGGELGPPLVVLFEGWDAAGKGGAIKRLVAGLDPRHFSVYQIAAPTERELRHHFLWRFWPHVPGDGGMVIFDRSWYGRVLVERVEELCPPEQWQRAYQEIVDFESALTSNGAVVVKFWMHISDEEQLKRFERRKHDPIRRWKLTDEDWRNRAKRPFYEAAVEDMLAKTSEPGAKWHVVAAESKRYARVKVLRTVIHDLEKGMRNWGMEIVE